MLPEQAADGVCVGLAFSGETQLYPSRTKKLLSSRLIEDIGN